MTERSFYAECASLCSSFTIKYSELSVKLRGAIRADETPSAQWGASTPAVEPPLILTSCHPPFLSHHLSYHPCMNMAYQFILYIIWIGFETSQYERMWIHTTCHRSSDLSLMDTGKYHPTWFQVLLDAILGQRLIKSKLFFCNNNKIRPAFCATT